ncbi:inosine-uridine preferring nucleoside hydrolase [Paraphaeosphaeria minitans]|uniref:Inosine-uridine preferring nucleoside hydrolase n=1 Tax=Paraphaeosphaeria minitans TaxID=565426 RepID=A0A9P6GRQ6_9PLEO|nr:inosine-uridine preferring nucleoside hydrolase [Paraphaeosphaeria minitans]
MAPNKIIIDTDPGVDDVLALLLAFAAKPEELEVLMLSLTFGNVEVQNCLRNVVTLFHYIEKEKAWRRGNGRPEGFEGLAARKPIVAVGAEEPLAEHMMVADFFQETWKSLFKPTPEPLSPEEAADLQKVKEAHSLFTPSLKPAHEEMLKLLRDNEPDTITIVAIGPLTNLAIAAATDPEAFLRVKEVVVMGGAVNWPGNPPNLSILSSHLITSIPFPPFNLIKQPPTPLRHQLNLRNQMTPGAEFNTYADSIAAARVYALTSPNPKTTLPPVMGKKALPPYPEKLSRQLTVKLFPLDITEQHLLPRTLYSKYIEADALKESPLTEWASLFLLSTFRKIASLDSHLDADTIGLHLHDPLTVWYAMAAGDEGWKFVTEDLRVETSGQWTRGCCIVDRRERQVKQGLTSSLDEEVVGDAGGWRDARRGNRVQRAIESPGAEKFAGLLLERVFGSV